MLDAVKLMYAYDAWASARMFEVLAQLSQEEYETTVAGGSGTIRETLGHLIFASEAWLKWFDGTLTAAELDALKSDSARSATVAAAREYDAELRERIERCLATLSEEQVLAGKGETMADGTRWEHPFGEMLLHVPNHATFHRAQIQAAVRRCGYDPLNTDLIDFVELRSGEARD